MKITFLATPPHSTRKQWGYPPRMLVSAPLSGNKTKQITSRGFSSCCHLTVFPTVFLFAALLYSGTEMKLCKVQGKVSSPSAWDVRSMSLLAEGPHAWQVWQVMGMSQRWWSAGFEHAAPLLKFCTWGQISCRSSPPLKQNIFYFLCDCAENKGFFLENNPQWQELICEMPPQTGKGLNSSNQFWTISCNIQLFCFSLSLASMLCQMTIAA